MMVSFSDIPKIFTKIDKIPLFLPPFESTSKDVANFVRAIASLSSLIPSAYQFSAVAHLLDSFV